MLFQLVPGGFSYLINWLEFKLEKILGFRNMREKLEIDVIVFFLFFITAIYTMLWLGVGM